jgi:hypothetical protein
VVPTPPSCLPGPSIPTQLAAYDKTWTVHAIASSGEQVFIASSIGNDTSAQGRIARISLSTLVMDTHELSTYAHRGQPLGLLYQAGTVIYRPSFYNPSIPDERYAPNVERWDLQAGTSGNLPNPTNFDRPNLSALTGNSKGEVFWSVADGDHKAIAKWDPCTANTEVLVEGPDAVMLLADDSTVYWQEPKGGRLNAFGGFAWVYSMPNSAGGAKSLLLDVAADSWNTPVLLAIDDGRLYYLSGTAPRLSLEAIPKQGGAKQSVSPVANPLWLDRSTIDDTHIYWVESDDTITLRRTPKQGGTTETLWSTIGRPIQAITADACNVYWVATNPQEIYYRAK